MFRTVFITKGQYLTVKDEWLLINYGDTVKKVPLSDIKNLFIDNVYINISAYALQKLAKYGINAILCDDTHLPCCNLLPLNTHYRPYGVLKKQIALTDTFKNLLWQRIVKAKIINQGTALKISGAGTKVCERMQQLAQEVLSGDTGNREGIAAKMFFRNFYGCDFIRFENDIINIALNYGYAVIRSSVARSLCAYGYNCALGIHHISETNPFNLADDLMEPLRPLADIWVWQNNEDLVDTLTKNNKIGLANIINGDIACGNKIMKVHNAVDKYIASLTTAIDNADVNKLIIPVIGEKFV